ncbi:CsbD family protein [Sphingomonas melonis]|jgi:uncharacterized protein YjbJ (UPF0337 family)|uniref:Uncharacterized protein YjbJ (UPF0337 family) n=1 Tax=Sphingomonas melonis TaxID=152682 RepID=A0A7Y9K4A2_9SPHN|nr:CsbD family protein [Sphingomonas melonis]NYD91789.1 uncharacterized protein YjbJ (UPF0337 family) [Sphingomonas melonis]
MNKLISGIEGAINTAVGKAKQNADNPSLHGEGAEQEARGTRQQADAKKKD